MKCHGCTFSGMRYLVNYGAIQASPYTGDGFMQMNALSATFNVGNTNLLSNLAGSIDVGVGGIAGKIGGLGNILALASGLGIEVNVPWLASAVAGAGTFILEHPPFPSLPSFPPSPPPYPPSLSLGISYFSLSSSPLRRPSMFLFMRVCMCVRLCI